MCINLKNSIGGRVVFSTSLKDGLFATQASTEEELKAELSPQLWARN